MEVTHILTELLSLRVQRSRQPSLDLQEGTKNPIDNCCELRASVRSEYLGETMEFSNMIDIHAGYIAGVCQLVAQNQISYF